MSMLLRHEKDVDNVENGEGVRDKQDDKPVPVTTLRSTPQRVPFPWNRPQRNKHYEPDMFLHKYIQSLHFFMVPE